VAEGEVVEAIPVIDTGCVAGLVRKARGVILHSLDS